MSHLNVHQWEIAVGLVLFVALAVVAVWLLLHKRPTPEEIERARRKFLVQSGRILDGMLLDVCEMEVTLPPLTKREAKAAAQAEAQPPLTRTLTLLLFSYRIGGVDYECSQDITDMPGIVDTAQVRVGFPCSARYQPGNPQNSIVVAEEWSGLRLGLPVLPAYDDPDPLDRSHLDRNAVEHLRPGRG